MWLQAFGGLLLVVASVLVFRVVIAADAASAQPAPRRRASDHDLPRAA